MKQIITRAVFAASLISIASSGIAGDTFKLNKHNLKAQPQISQHHKQVLQNALRGACVDLAVFARKQRMGDRVRITYGVTNVSRTNYVSNPNQQAISISTGGRALANRAFAILNAGQTRSWTVDVPLPFEFPNTYQVRFNHDPDLYIDGNSANDDCKRANNRREVTVAHNG